MNSTAHALLYQQNVNQALLGTQPMAALQLQTLAQPDLITVESNAFLINHVTVEKSGMIL
jgi:hypothetical protein